MERDIRKLFKVLKKAGHFDRLEFISVFGSRAEGTARKDSDLDVCLYYDISGRDVLRRLSYRIKGSLPETIDVGMFQLLPLQVRKDIFRGKIIYKKHKYRVYEIAQATFAEYQAFAPVYKFSVLNTKSNPRRFAL